MVLILFLGLIGVVGWYCLNQSTHRFSYETSGTIWNQENDSSIFDRLMLFAAKDEGGEKTEKASQKKIEDSRKKGQVPKSNDVNNFVTLLGAFSFLLFFGPSLISKVRQWLSHYIVSSGDIERVLTPHQLFLEGVNYFLEFIVMLFLPMMIVGVVSNIAQTGFLFVVEPLKPQFSKLNPIQGFKEMFSQRKWFDLLKNILKLGLVVFISWQFVVDKQADLLNLSYMKLTDALFVLGTFVRDLMIRILMLIGVLSVADYAFQRYKFMDDLKMSKQEQKEEYKQLEGDPVIKGLRRQKQREIAMNQMMKMVPEATVIVTNPTHYAVALRYRMDQDNAPVVLAKGVDAKALKIREIAKEHDIPIIENRPLARSLYATVDINHEIPFEMYEAVRDLLVLVYELDRKKNYR